MVGKPGETDAASGLRLTAHCGGGSFKTQMKKADASGAALALLLGESEVERGAVAVKPLRGQGEQRDVGQRALIEALGTAQASGRDIEATLLGAAA